MCITNCAEAKSKFRERGLWLSSELFWGGAKQDIMLEEYPGVDDKWLEVIGTQGTSLLALNISGSAVTDAGLEALDMCNNLQALILSYCDHISDAGLISLTGNYVPRIPTAHTHTTFQSFIPSPQICRNACLHNPFLSPVCSQFSCTSKCGWCLCKSKDNWVFQGVFSGFANLTMLSFRNSNLITAAGMHCFAHLVNLKHLDLECCPHIHGGLVHIKGNDSHPVESPPLCHGRKEGSCYKLRNLRILNSFRSWGRDWLSSSPLQNCTIKYVLPFLRMLRMLRI